MVNIILAGWKPTVIVLFVIAVCVWGVWFVERAAVAVDANGRPLDWAGESVPCPECEEGIPKFIDGYRYRCPKCGTTFKAHHLAESIRPEYFDVLRGSAAD